MIRADCNPDVDRTMVDIVPESIMMKIIIGPAQSDGPQNFLACDPLMFKIVNGIIGFQKIHFVKFSFQGQ